MAQVDLEGLMGMLSVGDKGGGTPGTKAREGGERAWASRAAGEAQGRRKTGAERSEEHRQKGNELFKLGAYESAVDYYTRAVNAEPGNAKALGNRCAAYTMMKSFAKALTDAEYALRIEPKWAKLHSRKAVAHFYLKQYDESVDAYSSALTLEPSNEEYRSGLEQAKKLAGSAENQRRRREKEELAARERRERLGRERAAPPAGGQGRFPGSLEDQVKRKAEQEKAKVERYEKELAGYKKARRVCAEKWRVSTGKDNAAGEREKPEEDRGRSVRVDIFGYLRGKCLACDCDCRAWHRDIDSVPNAWGNLEAIKCSVCGHDNTQHEDCGQYPLNEPLKPNLLGHREELKIPGIHKAH
ncbi:HSP70-HSP90 organizing protein [Chloropicon primus]|uniref:HSP70-HSP90 organizing protein n=1 Tax=Chloropicon primus TaxID=1764295 RepID=A0A5B8MD69_9CHLO|nr:HSP70-HSP90 organizing protein [Chloropicon primus]UPQ96773.1 HSP70-HSP90 organizing protein [Chloropicon primus]|eukprot:QDZ17555.1 HSP70-HSP90 organizing protein [Chloropicon primus]